MTSLGDQPLRHVLANELHARPAPEIAAPCHAVFLALKQPHDAVNRDRACDRMLLLDLLDRFGARHPPEGAVYHYAKLGRHHLRWESHTEFVTYTMFVDGLATPPFDAGAEEVFPRAWLARASDCGSACILSAAFVRVEPLTPGARPDEDNLRAWFSAESLAMAEVNDGAAIIATDFTIDAGGHTRFAVFARDGIGKRRLGRIVQRLLELEAYMNMALLRLTLAQEVARKAHALDNALARQAGQMNARNVPREKTLAALLDISARIEALLTRSASRFSATEAYAAIVHERIQLLRERRYEERQTLNEFITRRFEPAMRTCRSVGERIESLALRAKRVSDLLGTRVEVERAAQNQELLAAMNRRTELQLRPSTPSRASRSLRSVIMR